MATPAPPVEKKVYVCPECGREFSRPQSLGVHRKTVHGIVGSSSGATRERAKRKEAAELAAFAAAEAERAASGGGNGGRKTRAKKTRAKTGSTRKKKIAGARKSTAKRPYTRRTAATTPNGAVDRQALLKALFPKGLPPRVDVITGAMEWLDRAEELARG